MKLLAALGTLLGYERVYSVRRKGVFASLVRKIFETGDRFGKSNFFLFYPLKMFLPLPYLVFCIAVFDVYLFYLHKVREHP